MNKVWVADQPLGSAGERFFAPGTASGASSDWRQLRRRREYAQAARAVLTSVSFVAILVASIAPH